MGSEGAAPGRSRKAWHPRPVPGRPPLMLSGTHGTAVREREGGRGSGVAEVGVVVVTMEVLAAANVEGEKEGSRSGSPQPPLTRTAASRGEGDPGHPLLGTSRARLLARQPACTRSTAGKHLHTET